MMPVMPRRPLQPILSCSMLPSVLPLMCLEPWQFAPPSPPPVLQARLGWAEAHRGPQEGCLQHQARVPAADAAQAEGGGGGWVSGWLRGAGGHNRKLHSTTWWILGCGACLIW